mmetsp:Transcript_19520/g.42712  ORF Transcript_19520/g.42712 Transcript_19520/m.42712 type:complete len:107 (-) Transcript_19520:13-333(-)
MPRWKSSSMALPSSVLQTALGRGLGSTESGEALATVRKACRDQPHPHGRQPTEKAASSCPSSHAADKATAISAVRERLLHFHLRKVERLCSNAQSSGMEGPPSGRT